jgi:hypothetical protein
MAPGAQEVAFILHAVPLVFVLDNLKGSTFLNHLMCMDEYV